jgi:hypothetical protein
MPFHRQQRLLLVGLEVPLVLVDPLVQEALLVLEVLQAQADQRVLFLPEGLLVQRKQ